jgi:pimeloyl-ACP methyl ester carboxylesterase
MASDAGAVLEAVRVQRAHTWGVSMGGMIAQEFALQFTDRVDSLVLGCTMAEGPQAVKTEPEARHLLMVRSKMTPEQAMERPGRRRNRRDGLVCRHAGAHPAVRGNYRRSSVDPRGPNENLPTTRQSRTVLRSGVARAFLP